MNQVADFHNDHQLIETKSYITLVCKQDDLGLCLSGL